MRANNGCHRSIIHRFNSLPLLRRPSFVIVPPWVACWVRTFNNLFVVVHWLVTCVTVDNKLHRSIIFRTPRSLTFALQEVWLSSLFFWRRRWQSWGSPCNKTHHWSWFRCDLFLPLNLFAFLLPSLQSEVWNCNGLCWTNTEDDFLRHVWNFLQNDGKLVLGVGFIWFGIPDSFDRTINQAQLCGSWKHVSLWDFFPL